MASVEQRESQTSALATFSNSLEIFDTFKSSHEEEKDSDEESFHLPMLDCDEDFDSNNKDTPPADIPNGETEDDILNKFDTDTPDVDIKVDENILNDTEDTNEKSITLCKNNPISKSSEVSSDASADINKGIDCDLQPTTTDTSRETISMAEEKETSSECKFIDKYVESDTPELNKQNDKQDKPTDYDMDDIHEVVEVNGDQLKTVDSAMITENIDLHRNKDVDSDKKIADEKMKRSEVVELMEVDDVDDSDKSNKEAVDECVQSNQDVAEIDQSNKEVVDDSEKTNKEVVNESELSTKEVVEKSEQSHKYINETAQSDKESVDNVEKKANEVVNDIVDKENSDMDVDKASANNIGNTEISNIKVVNDGVDSTFGDDKSDKEAVKASEKEVAEDGNKTDDKDNVSAQTEIGNSTYSAPKEMDDDSNKSDNLQCEDLLDISVIRDVDEDNASAIAENLNSNDAPSSDKSDNDDPDYEKGEDDSEIEQEDEKDNIEFDECNSSNFGEAINEIADESVGDDTIKDDTDMDSNSGQKVLDKPAGDEPKITDDASNTASESVDQTDSGFTSESNSDITRKLDENVKENHVKSQEAAIQNKRPLVTDGNDEAGTSPKKMRLSSSPANEKRVLVNKDDKVKTLTSFKDYMKTKKVSTKLTRSDLEQFCLQKICEAIIHRTDVGELHQTIKKQEQIIDNLRKDLQQLTKQTRDLDIVNKKLMTELRIQNGSKKPLVPLKITRSVGLQVKLNIGTETNVRRKQVPTTTPSPKVTTPTTTPTNRPRSIAPANSTVIRQVVASSPRKPSQSPQTTPILSQALQQQQQQNRQNTPTPVQKRTPVRHKTPEAAKPGNPGVIDLTDEDDKASKNATTPFKTVNKVQSKTVSIVQAKPVPNKSMNGQTKTTPVSHVKTVSKLATPTRTVQALPQGVRLTPTQVKNGIAIPTSMLNSTSGTTTQLMYVVQPSSLVTSTAGGNQKALLLNFQPSNGVLTSTLNGSAVSVIPKSTNAVQLKTVLPRKHPAPLPISPITPSISLKPLLPKPHLSIRKTDTGIILQWRMPYNLELYEGIASYQLFAYQETNAPPNTDMWRKVGDVKALALPMACTLTQFADKNKYYFAVRSVDIHKRLGAFSDPEEISL